MALKTQLLEKQAQPKITLTDGLSFVPNLVTGVWTGADNRSVRFEIYTWVKEPMALPIWGEYMQIYKTLD